MISSTRLRNSAEMPNTHRHHLIMTGHRYPAFRLIDQEIGADRRHHDERFRKSAVCPARQSPAIEHLQEHVEDVGMRLLDLVEQKMTW